MIRPMLMTAPLWLSLIACAKPPEAAAIDNNAAMIEDSLERQADTMEAVANNAADQNAAAALSKGADTLHAASDHVADTAAAAKAKVAR